MCLGGGFIRKVMLVAITFLFSFCIWGFRGIELENPEMAEEKVLVGIGTIQIPETETVSVETRSVERKGKEHTRKRKLFRKSGQRTESRILSLLRLFGQVRKNDFNWSCSKAGKNDCGRSKGHTLWIGSPHKRTWRVYRRGLRWSNKRKQYRFIL